jgi:hypothetical protein
MTSTYNHITKDHFEKANLELHFPALKRIHICVYSGYSIPRPQDSVSLADSEAYIKSEITPGLVARGYEVTVESMALDYHKFQCQ